jgi:magnesium-transporting ATPase (P-type)
VSVYRDNNETISIPIEELLVGDIYRLEKGDIIPADSILIQVGHQLDEDGLEKPFEQTKDKTVVVREANVPKLKNVIKDTNVKDFLN